MADRQIKNKKTIKTRKKMDTEESEVQEVQITTLIDEGINNKKLDPIIYNQYSSKEYLETEESLKKFSEPPNEEKFEEVKIEQQKLEDINIRNFKFLESKSYKNEVVETEDLKFRSVNNKSFIFNNNIDNQNSFKERQETEETLRRFTDQNEKTNHEDSKYIEKIRINQFDVQDNQNLNKKENKYDFFIYDSNDLKNSDSKLCVSSLIILVLIGATIILRSISLYKNKP